MHRHYCRVWTLPPETEIKNQLYGFPSLGAPAREFWRSRRVWALLDGDDLYLNAYVCWVASIIRRFGFYAQFWAWAHELDLAETVTGLGIVEAGCCDTS